MELSAAAIQQVIHPTAAFAAHYNSHEAVSTPLHPSWEASLLNPKNRIDSLDLPEKPLWRIDGCTGLGTQYYLVPLFLNPLPPVRMDVFISQIQPTLIRDQLDLNVAFHVKDAPRLGGLAITRHIIRTLDLWVAREFEDLHAFTRFYQSSPFGTRIVFDSLSLDIRSIQVRVGFNHNLERQLLSLSALSSFWGPEFRFPPVIDFSEVHVVKVLHDSVCLVQVQGQLLILKALTSGAKYLYHELRTLCAMKQHPNVIARPVHLIKKDCGFGGKKAIVGFTTIFQSKGGLRDLLPQLRTRNQLAHSDQLKWSIQLTAALQHLRSSCAMYYPDLRLDNLVLSETSDIVMVDFEQRGVWCEFGAPEVNYIEYILVLATEEDFDDQVRDRYRNIIKRLVPAFDDLRADRYSSPKDGYNISWIALNPAEQEAAEVYMLGRVLWCIFEGVSGPQKAAVWQSYPCESDLEFPQFARTPPEMRKLIDRCTRGRRGALNDLIVREGSKLVLKGKNVVDCNADDVMNVARQFWERELQAATDFLLMRQKQEEQGVLVGNCYGRPTLNEVLTDLKAYRDGNL